MLSSTAIDENLNNICFISKEQELHFDFRDQTCCVQNFKLDEDYKMLAEYIHNDIKHHTKTKYIERMMVNRYQHHAFEKLTI